MLEAARLPARQRLQDLHRFGRRHRVHAAVDGAGLRRSARAGGRLIDQDADSRCARAGPSCSGCRRSTSSTTRQASRSASIEFIGRRPIAAFGNSDGDLEMLQWTTMTRRHAPWPDRPSHRCGTRIRLRSPDALRPTRQGAGCRRREQMDGGGYEERLEGHFPAREIGLLRLADLSYLCHAAHGRHAYRWPVRIASHGKDSKPNKSEGTPSGDGPPGVRPDASCGSSPQSFWCAWAPRPG